MSVFVRSFQFFVVTAVVASVLSCSPQTVRPKVGDAPPKLFVISSLIGYIEPCGCTVDLLLGGIDRLVGEIDRARAAGPVAVVVVGPHFFEKAVPDHRVEQERAKAKLIARGLKRMKVDAFTTTDAEYLQGSDFYAELKQGLGGTEVTVSEKGGTGALLSIGDLKVGIVGLTDDGTHSAPEARALVEDKLAGEAKRLRNAGANLVVGLAVLPRAQLRQMARRLDGVDIWLLGREPSENDIASPAGESFIIEAGDRGRNLGVLTLSNGNVAGKWADPFGAVERRRRQAQRSKRMRESWGGRGFSSAGKPKEPTGTPSMGDNLSKSAGPYFKYELVPMTKDVVGAKDMADAVKAYNQSLKAMNLATAGQVTPPAPGESRYVGAGECTDCHPDAEAVWSSTRHGKAWATLEDANKTFDSECVGCHVTGWQRPGGSILGQVAGLENVQCEVCHGPGELHSEEGDPALIIRAAPEALCQTCHNKHHSPKFDYETYLPKILGPGHEKRSPH